jgi:multidrug efflux pump subunit AcrB
MNFGAPTPVEVAVIGPDFAATRAYASKVRNELATIPELRDLQVEQALDYPAVNVNIDRQLAGQLGVTVNQIGQSFAAATSSADSLRRTTSAAMIAGMLPMALASGEGADATAPLGRAVIGGLAVSTLATCSCCRRSYSLVQRSADLASASLDPDDPDSAHHAQGHA